MIGTVKIDQLQNQQFLVFDTTPSCLVPRYWLWSIVLYNIVAASLHKWYPCRALCNRLQHVNLKFLTLGARNGQMQELGTFLKSQLVCEKNDK